ncbi:MAG: SDR family NAD(P)-dependent oxidoreductase [Aminobacterium sp.]|jgi:NAD(P)-dependent dehydrogenase (short-subunit alcohol dehydrogenase family)|nr:SDR family NAD(P)-dependent oxidoreductase [Aminobacterium sp.]MDD3425276.1 SDR family NAD(P)-dependent oxidoreductase [Aminobacterium sp.]MDD3708236.1 SDR family NAD(P)-dependent oxidoreductase [Aminobacterium sp.]MDD4229151.1 SDR family NAD(P)-dependent oxidoreductase [Aminobacterium sp.]MDD4552017.1 SDR family NAD(P)-dependent oxidoreductase [Aminobacterium sp.]
MDLNLKSKVVIVTGGASGLGKAMAEAFAQEEATVIIADVNETDGVQFASELNKEGKKAEFLYLDVSNSEQVNSAIESVVKKHGRIDVLCNNAGINVRKFALDISAEEWQRVINVNLSGMFYCAQAVGRFMVKQGGGKIINTASVSAVRGHLKRAPYASAKGGVYQMTKVLAHEWGEHNVNVNAIGPGFVETPLTSKLISGPGVKENMISKIPMRRLGKTDDIVGPVLFLASPYSDYITGQLLLIDGGRTID